MNKRIQDLAMLARKHFPKTETSGEVWVFDEEKFALLIVQDCLLSSEPDPMAPEIDYDVEQKFYQRSAHKIKQHFGIE